MSYAVVWSENGGPEVAGRLDLDRDCVVLSGRGAEGTAMPRRVALDEITNVQFERGGAAPARRGRLLVVVRADGSRLELSSLEGAGALHELADELSMPARAGRG